MTRIVTGSSFSAVAHANIALAKYWGKANSQENLAAVPSLSLTLEALRTVTTVRFDETLGEDQLFLDHQRASDGAQLRASQLLSRVRERAGIAQFARVDSANSFPTASGLASSASGFAALAFAALGASGLPTSPSDVSHLARLSSVSAARSAYGGLVFLEAGGHEAIPLRNIEVGTDLALVIAVTKKGPKSTGSTSGMLHTQRTSPYYRSWSESAPAICREVLSSLMRGDLQRAGEAMEHSTLLMHASMMAARPALIYWEPGTLAAMNCVRELRAQGVLAYFTMDAGAHVKVLTRRGETVAIESALKNVPGVKQVIVSSVGPGAHGLADP